MFSNTFQSGFITVFYSVGSSPLSLWDKQVKNGHIRRVIDDEVKSLVLEISGTNVATTYITCPIKPRASLSIRLPFLVMIVKNMKKYFTFEIQILDDKDMHRRFRVSNFQSTTKVRPFCTTMPIGLSSGWNQIQFNLADFTRRAYGTLYLETMRVQVHANVRIRRIYFADRLYSEDEMPSEYRLFVPLSTKKDSKEKASDKMPSDFGKMVKPAEKAASAGATAELAAEPTAAPPSPVESPGEEVQIKVEELEGEKESVVTEAKQEAPPKEEAAGEKAETEAAEGAEEASPGGDVPPSEEAPTTEGEEGEEGEEAAGDTTAGEEATEPAATTEETTAEAPGEAPAEAPAEVPAEAPAEASAEAPAEAPTETPAETPAEATAEDPAEAPAETAAIESGDEGGEEKPAE